MGRHLFRCARLSISSTHVLGVLEGVQQVLALANLLLDEHGVCRVQELSERELVNITSGERYATLDETAVFPRPEAEGEGVCVGRSLCSPMR